MTITDGMTARTASVVHGLVDKLVQSDLRASQMEARMNEMASKMERIEEQLMEAKIKQRPRASGLRDTQSGVNKREGFKDLQKAR
jgi:uncharacterized coiled-coil protein SlyX